MTIDTTINIGHVITLIAMLITVIMWGSTIKNQVQGLGKRMQDVETEMKNFTETYIATRLLDNRLDDLNRRVVYLENRQPTSGRKSHLVTD